MKAFLLLVMIVSPAFAQQELQRARPSTRPAAATNPTTAPTTQPKLRLVAKKGAPYYVREWIAKQPYIQRALIVEEIELEKAAIEESLVAARAEVTALEQSGNFHRSAGGGIGQKEWVDRRAEGEWAKQLRAAKAKVGGLLRMLKTFDAQTKQRIAEAERNPKIMTDLIAARHLDELVIGKVGALGTVVVYEIIDKENMVVRWEKGDGTILCKGFSTEGIVDEQHKELAGCIITGTTKRDGRTMFVAEPFDFEEWIEIVPR